MKKKRKNKVNEGVKDIVENTSAGNVEKEEKTLSIKDVFEARTGYKMNIYIAEHFSKALNKYGRKLFFDAFDVTLNRNEILPFEAPTDMVRYMYAVCKNMAIANTWDEVE